MHGWTRLASLAPLALMAALGGCNNDAKMNEQALLDENRDLRSELDRTRGELDDSQARALRAETELEDTRQRLADAEAQPPLPSDSAEVTWGRRDGQEYATVPGDVLFDSGKHDLKPAAQSALKSVARELNGKYAGRPIRIDGFTDTDRIRTNKYVSNYHLGFARAYSVGQYLIKQGVAKDRISYGSFGPLESKATKAESRRVEITVE